jgi:hypothetical protein
LYRVDQEITSALKGYDLSSFLSPDGSQLIYLKHDLAKKDQYEKEISRLVALDLRTNKAMKYINFPEKIVTVLFNMEQKQKTSKEID